MHSVPVPINVRCNSNSDIIVRRSDCGRNGARGENTCPCEHLGGAVTILADQVLELRIRQGQVHIVRKPRIEDDEDREFRATNAPYLGDDV